MAVTLTTRTEASVSLKDLVARAAYDVVAAFEFAANATVEFYHRRKTAAQLNALSDEMLADIGLNRGDIEEIVARR